jgi:PAS domain S-box-containing protein
MASSGRYTHIDGEVHRRVPFGCYKIGRIAAGQDFKFLTNNVVNDERIHNRDWARNLGLVSFAGYRLLSREGNPIGVLALFSSQPISYDEDVLLGDVANLTAQVIQMMNMEESIKEALKISEARFQAILDNATAIIYLKDCQGNYVFVNRRYEELLHHIKKEGRCKEAQLTGKTDYDIFPKETAEYIHSNEQKVLEKGIPMEFDEVLMQDDGPHSYISIKFPLKDGKGITYGIAGMSTDITDRKRIEQEKEKLQGQLLHSQKLEAIGQLAAGVAHEINNPIGFISGNLRSLSKYINKFSEFIALQAEVIEAMNSVEATETLKKTRKKMKLDYIIGDINELIVESLDGADRVSNIVQNLRAFSRVDEANYKEANINECIESTINIAWNELKYKAIVKKEYGALPLIKCYPQELNQVFLNLLMNACQAIEKQGEIGIKTWKEDDAVFISISDTGYGIPQENLNRLFEPFFTTKDVGKGTGLGLSISYDIVKKHKGDITVQSEIGKGTEFTVKIPVNGFDQKADENFL